MTLRTLSKSSDTITGYRTWHPAYGYPPEYRSRDNKVDVMTDDVAAGDNHLFNVSHTKYTGLVANGTKTSGAGAGDVTYYNVPLTHSNMTALQHLSISSSTDGVYASQLLARTNPSRPDIDLPVFIAELRDLPMLVKLSGDNLLKKAASANLSYQFGWKPLVSDVMKLLSFSDHAQKRYRELKKLYSGGLSRTIDLDNLSASYTRPTELICQSDAYYAVSARQSSVSQLRVWGHVKWKPTTLPPKTDDELRSIARRAALGLYLDVAQAWELMPWSWLVDWFSSVGSFLNAHRNGVPATPTDVCIMRHQKTEHNLSPWFVPQGFKVEWGYKHYETKSRSPSAATISTDLPYLDVRKLSILGSLSVLKGGRLTGPR